MSAGDQLRLLAGAHRGAAEVTLHIDHAFGIGLQLLEDLRDLGQEWQPLVLGQQRDEVERGLIEIAAGNAADKTGQLLGG